ncbi:protein PET100 homolog, mitochondrial [Tiliqua scincoides]|uniref:protein PET100 homolog, mitochondrial n=1 Tax=Tiliqua scincoides TaxID=71010 RepID=UPI00346345F9
MGVKLEVFRMMLYLSFPVAMFWISNQAEYFEEYVIKRKREIYPPDDDYRRKELEDFKERMRKMKEEQLLQAAKE